MLLVSLHTYVSHVALKKGSKAIVGEIHDPDSNPLRLPSACAFQVGVGGGARLLMHKTLTSFIG